METIVLFSEWEASPRASLIIIGSLLDLRFIPKTTASRLLRLLDLLVTYMATLFFSPRLGHIWVMKEYGVAESWTKKKCIPMVGVASIFGCIINGKLRIHKCSYRQVKWSFGLCFQNLSFDLVECIVLLDGGVHINKYESVIIFYFLSELSSHESIAFDMEFFQRFVFDVKCFVFEKKCPVCEKNVISQPTTTTRLAQSNPTTQ